MGISVEGAEILRTVSFMFSLWLLLFYVSPLIFSLFLFLNTWCDHTPIFQLWSYDFFQSPNPLMQLNIALSLCIGQIPSDILPEGTLSFLVALLRILLFTSPIFKFAFEEKPCNILQYHHLCLTIRRYPFIRWWPVSFLFQIFTLMFPYCHKPSPVLFVPSSYCVLCNETEFLGARYCLMVFYHI